MGCFASLVPRPDQQVPCQIAVFHSPFCLCGSKGPCRIAKCRHQQTEDLGRLAVKSCLGAFRFLILALSGGKHFERAENAQAASDSWPPLRMNPGPAGRPIRVMLFAGGCGSISADQHEGVSERGSTIPSCPNFRHVRRIFYVEIECDCRSNTVESAGFHAYFLATSLQRLSSRIHICFAANTVLAPPAPYFALSAKQVRLQLSIWLFPSDSTRAGGSLNVNPAAGIGVRISL